MPGSSAPQRWPAPLAGFPPDRRGHALGIWGASAGVSNLLGLLLGGVLTVALGWRADWRALVPLAIAAAWGTARHVRLVTKREPVERSTWVVNQGVLAAGFVAGLTFAVMIGSFYIAEQYLQRVVGYSALGASSVLVLVAVAVRVAAPLAGRLVDERGEQQPAILGFLAAGGGLLVLGIPGVSLHSAATIAPLIPGRAWTRHVVRTNLARSTERGSVRLSRPHLRDLSVGRLLGAAVGAGLAGLALSAGPTATMVHVTLLVACSICILVGIPACMGLLLPGYRDHAGTAGLREGAGT